MEMADTGSRQEVSDRRTLLALLLAAALGAALGYCIQQWLSTPFVRDREQNPVAVDLLAMARGNRLRLDVPPGANAIDYIQTKTLAIGGDTRQVLYMHPPSSATFQGRLLDEVRLEFSMGLDPEVWDKPGDGVEFQVGLRDGGMATTLFATYLDPKRDPSCKRWVDGSVDLSRFAYREIELVLRTLPGRSADFDWAGWAAPRMVYIDP